MSFERRERTTRAVFTLLVERGAPVRAALHRALKLAHALEEAGQQLQRWGLVWVELGLQPEHVTPWLAQCGYAPVRSATVQSPTRREVVN